MPRTCFLLVPVRFISGLYTYIYIFTVFIFWNTVRRYVVSLCKAPLVSCSGGGGPAQCWQAAEAWWAMIRVGRWCRWERIDFKLQKRCSAAWCFGALNATIESQSIRGNLFKTNGGPVWPSRWRTSRSNTKWCLGAHIPKTEETCLWCLHFPKFGMLGLWQSKIAMGNPT